MDFEKQLPFYHNHKERFVDFYERAFMGDSEALLFTGIIGFLWIMFGIDSYLNFRQRKILKELTNPSAEVLTLMSNENYIRARDYSLERNSFNMYSSWYSMLQITIILMSNALPSLWGLAARSVIPWTAETTDLPIEEDLTEENEIAASIAFLLYATSFTFLDGLPWKFYNKFFIEEKYGYNKVSGLLFLLDQMKSFVISLCLILPISYCLLYIIKSGGSMFYFHAWSFSLAVMMLLMFVYPEFIAPMFDSYVPLYEGSLKTSIEDLTDRINFPLTRVFVVQGSKRSSHSQSYLYGFWKNKRIVLFDTLLSNYKFPDIYSEHLLNTTGDESLRSNSTCTNEEILAIVAHELGHWQFNHVIQNLIIGQINLFIMFVAFGNLFNYGPLFKTFGFKEVGTPDLIKLVLIFQFLFSPYNAIVEFMMTWLSRQNELQADAFATKLGMGQKLINGLIKLQSDNLTFPYYDRWYSLFNLSHPPLLERIKAIKEISTEDKI